MTPLNGALLGIALLLPLTTFSHSDQIISVCETFSLPLWLKKGQLFFLFLLSLQPIIWSSLQFPLEVVFFFFFLMFPNKREAAFYWFLFLIFYTFELSHERLSFLLLPFLWPHPTPLGPPMGSGPWNSVFWFGEFLKKMLHGVLKPASYHPPVSLLSTSVTSFSRFYFQF